MIPDVQGNQKARDDPTLPPVGRMAASTPAPSMGGWGLVLRLLGVVVALVGSAVFLIPSTLPMELWLLEPLLIGVVAAMLLRSFWAVLIVPAACMVSLYVVNAYQMHGFDLQAWFTGGFIDADILMLLVVPLVIGAGIGAPLGMWIQERMGRSASMPPSPPVAA